jgi:protein tyrosine/serine phosphatase
MGARWRRARNGSIIAVVAAIVSIGSYFGLLHYSGNVHSVEPGQVYRSAQLDRAAFERVIRDYGIKSILNLRGAAPNTAWYTNELAVSKTRGVLHYDYGISARRIVTPSQIADILTILRTAPKPILIHCQAGADRSGLVAALYEVALAGRSSAEADQQLSLRYGHFPYLMSKTGAMDASFWAYVRGH